MSDPSGVKILVLVGSLRAASINRQLAELAAETAPEGATLELFDRLGDLPFYNEDIDNDSALGGVAEPVAALRAAAAHAGAALVVTPEYNGSIPGVLKNALIEVSEDVEAGATLSEAMAKHPAAFDRLYVGMIKAG
ncbi:MAG: NAD(P)H-dependent oxidoreductase, partial [Mycobacterium sp.]